MWYAYVVVGLVAAGIASAVTLLVLARRRQAIPLVLIGTITNAGAAGAHYWEITMSVEQAFVAGSQRKQNAQPIPQAGSAHTFRVALDKLPQGTGIEWLRTQVGQRVVLVGRELLYANRPQELSVHGLEPLR